MDKKKRWLYTAVAAVVVFSPVLAELATGGVSSTLDSYVAHPTTLGTTARRGAYLDGAEVGS